MKAEIRQRLEYNRRKPVVEQLISWRAKAEYEALDHVAQTASVDAWTVLMNEWGREGE